ncbi:aldo/keto reductase [Aquibacillus albus]|uniref:Aryl-alcohol dehydrogenase-like predicted oxidoreductase n=1 Tax=Aquibacillus albus TaxID=1168171 RepID=A0ABS2MVR6_9BACI|nr:aldo/keto reductase [Aquibacillus albus]MBM7569975.1 aryl-alcohol dehydrogenase-like predicted oxidoreductase [Aquibacillus albus]
MEYTNLGRTGLKVSKLCLGTMNFGVDTEEKEAFKIMDAALDAGINYFDTANIYGWGDNAGLTEKIIGRWFEQGGNRREKVVLATKVYEKINNPLDGPNDEPGLSAYKIRRHLEDSLRRLKTDHVEIYMMHHIDRNITWDEVWQAFENANHQGKIDYVGSSNFPGWALAEAQAAAKARNFFGLVLEQHKYNLNCRLPELEVLPAAERNQIGVVPWSPLDGGLLGGNALNPDRQSRSSKNRERAERHREQLEQYSALCKEIGEREDTVALAWLLSNPVVNAPIIGVRTLDQLENSLRAVEVKLEDDVLAKLDEIFPGPGGQIPEVYAW